MSKFEVISAQFKHAETKCITIYGCHTFVNKIFKYAAVDENGAICVYEEEPIMSSNEFECGYFNVSGGAWEKIGVVTYIGDWRTSLIEI